MAGDIEEKLHELSRRIDVLTDRVNSLELDHLRLTRRVRRIPLLIPVRQATKVAISISAVLMVMALILAFSPTDIAINGWRFQSEGIKPEAIAAAGSAVGLYFTVMSHLRDKKKYQDDDGNGGK